MKARFVIELWMDMEWESEEAMYKACAEYIREQLDATAVSVEIIEPENL